MGLEGLAKGGPKKKEKNKKNKFKDRSPLVPQALGRRGESQHPGHGRAIVADVAPGQAGLGSSNVRPFGSPACSVWKPSLEAHATKNCVRNQQAESLVFQVFFPRNNSVPSRAVVRVAAEVKFFVNREVVLGFQIRLQYFRAIVAGIDDYRLIPDYFVYIM